MKFEKELKAGLVDAGFRHIKYRKLPESFWKVDNISMTVASGEAFAFQMLVNYEHTDCNYSIGKRDLIGWRGLTDRVRLEIGTEPELENCIDMKFLGYVKNEEGTIVSDPILKDLNILAEKGIAQAIWIEGCIPEGCKLQKAEIEISLFSREGYGDEEKVKTLKAELDILDISMEKISREIDFHLDLWQHPSNWARAYHVELWSDDHFEIIEHNLRELSSMGNKVVTAIVSDFPWAGQHCYEEYKNPSNLFEHNMVWVKKTADGKIDCDFAALDRYIELAMSLGIDREIDLFGLKGVWDDGFGSPIEDYGDAVRISYYDESSGTMKYMKDIAELRDYMEKLFSHIDEKGWWKETVVMSDHPVDDKVFNECKEFIESAAGNKTVAFKSAIYRESVIEKHGCKLDCASVSLGLAAKLGKKLDDLKSEVTSKCGNLTWYVCWFPERPNNFISSPLVDNRLIGWYTYQLGLDGFLRWDYAIWPTDPWADPNYKMPYWKAGDMYFVYPGADLRPIRTKRWENLRLGIQDFKIMKALEAKGVSKEEIEAEFIEPLIGRRENIEAIDETTVGINYNERYSDYEKAKSKMLQKLAEL